MTVCGIKHADGVCVMGECPHIKKCCPVVWDKSGKPQTNEEFMRSTTTEELAGAIYEWYTLGYTRGKNGKKLNSVTEVVEWLKETHK